MQCSGEGSALAPAVIGLTPPGTCSQQRIILPQYKRALFTTKNKCEMYFITQRPCCLWILLSEYNFILWSVSWWSSKTSKTLWWSSKAPLWRSSELVIIFQNWVKVKRSSWPVATNAGPGKIFHDFITNVNFLLFPFLFPPMLLQENIKLLLIVRVHFDFIKRPQHKKLEVFWCSGLVPSFEAFQKTFLPRTKSTSV